MEGGGRGDHFEGTEGDKVWNGVSLLDGSNDIGCHMGSGRDEHPEKKGVRRRLGWVVRSIR